MVKPFPSIRRHLAGLALLFPLLSAPEARAQTLSSRSSCFMVSQSSVVFRDTRPGQQEVEEVLLINNCRQKVTILSITGDPAIFGSRQPVPFDIASGGYWGVFLYFAPTTAGDHQGTVTVRLRAPRPEKAVITVQGKALAPPTISLSHDSLEATVAAGTAAPLNLDVTNDGDERIEAIVDLTGPALPRPAAGWRVLYLNTVIPAGQDADDFTRALSARPGVDTVISFDGTMGTPTLEQLLAYDVVMANGSSPWADAGAVGTALEQYLHAGGKLALLAGGMADGSPGRIPISSYFTFSAGYPLASGGQSASLEPHIINQGVGAFSSAAVIPSSSIGGPGMGSPLGHYENGHLVGAYAPMMPVVCLNIHPVDGGWSGDLAAWVGNAFDYLGGMMNWATYTKPWSNDFILVVTERSTRTLELKINTYRMAPGTYRGRIELNHNDPAATNPLIVPINLTVTP